MPQPQTPESTLDKALQEQREATSDLEKCEKLLAGMNGVADEVTGDLSRQAEKEKGMQADLQGLRKDTKAAKKETKKLRGCACC